MLRTLPSTRGRYGAAATRPDTDVHRLKRQQGLHGIVLAGAHAWGGCLLDEVSPRPWLPVAGRPLLGHILDWIRGSGIRSATVCGNSETVLFHRGLVRAEQAGVDLAFSEDVMPRGPAGCARDAGLACRGETFVAVDGTVLPRVRIADLLAEHQRTGAAVTLAVTAADSPAGDDAPGLQPAGIYVFSRAALELVPAAGYQDLKESLIPKLCRRGERVSRFVVPPHATQRAADADSYLAMNFRATEELCRHESTTEGYHRVADALVADSAKVPATARLLGPCLVAAGAAVEPGAMIIGPATVGTDSVVERGAVVSRSAVWDRCRVGAGARVDGTILADGAQVAAEMVLRRVVRVAPRRSGQGAIGRFVARWVPGRRRNRHRRMAGQFQTSGNFAAGKA